MRPSPRLIALAAAAALALPGAAALARADDARATVTLAAPAAKDRVIAGGVVWACQGTTCIGPVSRKRPLRVCRELVRELGEVVRYEGRDAAMDETELARCNS